MRERPCAKTVEMIIIRITPAYAGKTNTVPITLCDYWDHPRVCGKDVFFDLCTAARSGSPPRMRERRALVSAGGPGNGITPAYAGKT